MARIRLDALLAQRGLFDSRTRAAAAIQAGDVLLLPERRRAEKPGQLVAEDVELEVRPGPEYVSRGGVKLASALDAFGLDVRGLCCLDLGASTGGFTDCLLQRGAAQVTAVDVGYGQLAYKLRMDPRVVVMERTNARSLTPEAAGGVADLTVVDASFIGLGKLMPAIALCTRSGGSLVALVKPQFEAGREAASRGKGVIRDETVRARAIDRAAEDVERAGFAIVAKCDSALPGPKGNVEAFLHARRA